MKEFYKKIMEQQLAATSWGEFHNYNSPLEKLIHDECMSTEDSIRLHDHEFTLLLKDISQRAAEAENFGGTDWIVSRFQFDLEDALTNDPNLTKESLRHSNLSPHELSKLLRGIKNRESAVIYNLRKQGLSAKDISAQLKISEEEVRKVEHKLLRKYHTLCRQFEGSSSKSDDNLKLETFHALDSGHYRVFQKHVTGSTRYYFYHKDRLLATGLSLVLPNFPFVLQHNALIFNSIFDPMKTIFPGQFRTMIDADNPEAVIAKLTWLDNGRHQLQLNFDNETITFMVHTENKTHRFFKEDQLIAEILPLPIKQQLFDCELDNCMKVHEELSDETALLLMCFPLLRFAD